MSIHNYSFSRKNKNLTLIVVNFFHYRFTDWLTREPVTVETIITSTRDGVVCQMIGACCVDGAQVEQTVVDRCWGRIKTCDNNIVQ